MQNVTSHTRAGKGGKSLICPQCNELTSVCHFAWQKMVCPHCKVAIAKSKWLIKPKPESSPTNCILCGMRSIYTSQLNHPWHYENPKKCFHCGFDQEDSSILHIDEPINLQCPYMTPTVPSVRCSYLKTITPENLSGASRISYRCPNCNTYVGGRSVIVMNNLSLLRQLNLSSKLVQSQGGFGKEEIK